MHEKNTIEILSELVAIESISSDQGHQEDVMKSAQCREVIFRIRTRNQNSYIWE